MLQALDSSRKAERHVEPARCEWMSLLSRSRRALIEQEMSQLAIPEHEWLRQPEKGLVMLRGRIGGTGDLFNVGEATVTRCALRIVSGCCAGIVGIGYVLGRDSRHAELAALADAMLQHPDTHEGIECLVLEPLRAHLSRTAAEHRSLAAATRVDFFTVAREAAA